MAEKTPFFSVIIPTYNRRSFLKIAVDSVLGQSFSDFELIIVDDGSGDATAKMIKKYKDSRLRYFYQKHKGVSFARNEGLRQAKGKFVCFLDSDDRFRREKLEVTYKYIRQYSRYKIFHTEEVWYRKGKYLPQKKYHQKPHGDIFLKALKLCCVSISTAAIWRGVFKEVGVFDEKLPACEDYDFWLRAAARFPVFLIPRYLTIKEGGHLDQQSRKYPAMDKFRIYALAKIIKSGMLDGKKKHYACLEIMQKGMVYVKGLIKRKKTEEAKKVEEEIASLLEENGLRTNFRLI